MEPLKNIKKDNIFRTPDGYFDELPGMIQARIVSKNQSVWSLNQPLRYSLRYALPAILLIAGFFWILRLNPSGMSADYDQLLSEVSTDDLIAYLETSDLTTEDIIEQIPLDMESANELFNQQLLFDGSGTGNEEEILNELEEMI